MAAQQQSLLNVQTNLSNTMVNVETNLTNVMRHIESNILNKIDSENESIVHTTPEALVVEYLASKGLKVQREYVVNMVNNELAYSISMEEFNATKDTPVDTPVGKLAHEEYQGTLSSMGVVTTVGSLMDPKDITKNMGFTWTFNGSLSLEEVEMYVKADSIVAGKLRDYTINPVDRIIM